MELEMLYQRFLAAIERDKYIVWVFPSPTTS